MAKRCGTKKTTTASKKGTKYTCVVCGLVVTVDNVCGCVQTCDIACWGQQMTPKK